MSTITADETANLHSSFSAELTKSGLRVPPAELETLFEGYCGLRQLLARIPKALPMELEPAMIAMTSGGKIAR